MPKQVVEQQPEPAPALLSSNKESPDLEMLNLQIANNQNDTSNLDNNDNSM